MPIEIIKPIPDEVLAGGVGGGNYVLNSDSFDVALDGIPFLLGTGDERPYVREVQDIKKPMFDNFAEPGEYSMTEWWLRSQSDFGGGQGLIYQDPSVDLRYNIKFKQSAGVNPWTPGELQLLTAPNALTTTLQASDQDTFVVGYRSATLNADAAWVISNNLMKAYNITANTETAVNYDGGAARPALSLTSSGNRYYVASDRHIWTGVDEGVGTSIWDYTANNNAVIQWVKGRLMAGIDNKVYELVSGGPVLPAPKFTHLDPSWVWTDITEGPTSIYMSGFSSYTSAIYKFTLDTTGAVPTLASGGVVAASFPIGEFVNNIFCYLGTFIGISTNMGFRVGEIDANGDITYGPLLWDNYSGKIQGYDRFFYVYVDAGVALDPAYQDNFNDGIIAGQVVDCLYRVDLGQRTQETTTGAIRFAYATDFYTKHTANAQLRTFGVLSNRFVVGISGLMNVTPSAAFVDYWPTDREIPNGTYPLLADGWYQTGRVRYNTLEPKMFRYFSVRAPAPLEGKIDVDVIDAGGGITRYITYDAAHPPDVGDIPLSAIFTPEIYIALRFTLHRNESFTDIGAIINGWQIKALPAPIRQRIFTMTFLCFDHEMDKTGQTIGSDGYALERIQAIEQIAQKGNAILLQDLYNDIGAQVVIEQMQFVQLAPPGNVTTNYGGYLTVRLKTVSDVIG